MAFSFLFQPYLPYPLHPRSGTQTGAITPVSQATKTVKRAALMSADMGVPKNMIIYELGLVLVGNARNRCCESPFLDPLCNLH